MTDLQPTEHRFSPETELALDKAAQLLCQARMPLIYGLTFATLETQAVAVDIAEALRGIIDTPASLFVQQRGTTIQLYGGAHATHGEVQNFSDLGIDINIVYPDTSTAFTDLTVTEPTILCSVMSSKSNEQASDILVTTEELSLRLDEWLMFLKGGKSELIKLRIRSLEFRNVYNDQKWDELIERYQAAKYPNIGFMPEMLIKHFDSKTTAIITAQLEQIAIFKSQSGRAVSAPLVSTLNLSGAEYVLTARTGSPCAISFASGHAEFSPLDYSAENVFKRKLVDAILFVGFEYLSQTVRPENVTMPWMLIGSRFLNDEKIKQFKDRIIQCRNFYPAEETGTLLRCDGVPLPLRPTQKSDLPSMESVLKALLERIQNRKQNR